MYSLLASLFLFLALVSGVLGLELQFWALVILSQLYNVQDMIASNKWAG